MKIQEMQSSLDSRHPPEKHKQINNTKNRKVVMPTGGLRIELHIRYWTNKQRTHFEVHTVFFASSMDEFFPSPPTQNLIENPANER